MAVQFSYIRPGKKAVNTSKFRRFKGNLVPETLQEY